jgi:hypothetical protein
LESVSVRGCFGGFKLPAAGGDIDSAALAERARKSASLNELLEALASGAGSA